MLPLPVKIPLGLLSVDAHCPLHGVPVTLLPLQVAGRDKDVVQVSPDFR